MSGDKKLIYFMVALVIFLASILLIKIIIKPKYNPKIYSDIYNEYQDIFGEEDDEKIVFGDMTENYDGSENNGSIKTVFGSTSNNIKQGNVIGKILIPKINLKYPIIKETTAEYLEVAPTKYCGPDANEVRELSHSRP